MAKHKTEEELIKEVDDAIGQLVYPKYELQKAYNIYNCKLDVEQFRFLEESFGIGSPTSVDFIPLVKKHVDAIVGEYLESAIVPKITCKDEKTITNITRDKQLAVIKGVYDKLKQHLQNSILQFLDGKNITDKNVEQQLNAVVEDINSTYISEYEIAAQNIVEYILESKDIDFLEKRRILLLDLLITGEAYYKVVPSSNGTNIDIKILDPLNTFPDRNYASQYAKKSYRVVIREFLTKSQILNTYGKEMSKKNIEDLDTFNDTNPTNNAMYIRGTSGMANPYPGLDSDLAVTPGIPTNTNSSRNLITVYTVEWTETDDNFEMQRYEQVKIGSDIYILQKTPAKVTRSISNPTVCNLQTSGIFFTTRQPKAFSLVLACESLQTKYNILHFYRDSLLASSGTVGDWIDVTNIPEFLGVTMPERVQKWLAYKKKAGVALIKPNEDGGPNNNTMYNGYDDTLKMQAVQAIELAIERVETTCSSITGVFRERLNGIQQKDAVSNIKVGVQNSFVMTKQYTHQMDLLTTEMILDSLNLAKVVWKKGLKGCITLGDLYQKIFVALPEHFTVTDFDINIESGTTVAQHMNEIKTIIPEFIKAQMLDPNDVIETITAKSLTYLKQKLKQSLSKKAAQLDNTNQLNQKLEEMSAQLQQMTTENQNLQNKIQELDQNKLQIEQEKLEHLKELEWFKARVESKFKEDKIKVDERKVDLEMNQLYDGNPYNNKVKF